MNLEDLLVQLMEEDGLTEDEAMKLAAARIRAHRKTAITKRSTESASVVSVQDDGRGVDYGDETPAQARQRWEQQELADPQGVYSPGGSSKGGIFGAETIAMDDYDPDATNRTVAAVAAVQGLQVQKQILRELEDARADRQRQLAPPVRRQLDAGRGDGRRLSRKRER